MRSITRSTARAALGAVAVVLRTLAVVLCALVVADMLDIGVLHAALLGANNLAVGVVPAQILGVLVFRTPMGGAFRGDFALVAVAFFVIDWLLARTADRI